MVFCIINFGGTHEQPDAHLTEPTCYALSSQRYCIPVFGLSGNHACAQWFGKDTEPDNECRVDETNHKYRRIPNIGSGVLAVMARNQTNILIYMNNQ